MNGGIFLKAAKAADLNRTVVDPRHFTLSKQYVPYAHRRVEAGRSRPPPHTPQPLDGPL